MDALNGGDFDRLKSFAKADKHCHSIFSARLESIEDWAGTRLEPPLARLDGLTGMTSYISSVLNPVTNTLAGFEFTARAGVAAAAGDGVTILEMSFGSRFAHFYPNGVKGFVGFIQTLVAEVRDQVELRPELGFIRQDVLSTVEFAAAFEAIESGGFRGIDLYGDEDGCSPEEVADLFGRARSLGLRLKAHVGEFGRDAEAVRRTVEILSLDAVQHGIAAAASDEVMRWLSERRTVLNVCPTSNVMLGAVPSLREHPIRKLLDHGVAVTINTDDRTIFGQSVSQEYLNLYQAGGFAPEELDEIRRASLT